MCTLNRPVSTLNIQCAHWFVQCAHWEIYVLSDVQCRYWVPAPAAWQQQPATTQQQQLVEFYVAFSTGHGKQLGATALHPCISVVKNVSNSLLLHRYNFKNSAVGSTIKTCVPPVNLILLQKNFTGSQKYAECAHRTKIFPVSTLGITSVLL